MGLKLIAIPILTPVQPVWPKSEPPGPPNVPTTAPALLSVHPPPPPPSPPLPFPLPLLLLLLLFLLLLLLSLPPFSSHGAAAGVGDSHGGAIDFKKAF